MTLKDAVVKAVWDNLAEAFSAPTGVIVLLSALEIIALLWLLYWAFKKT